MTSSGSSKGPPLLPLSKKAPSPGCRLSSGQEAWLALGGSPMSQKGPRDDLNKKTTLTVSVPPGALPKLPVGWGEEQRLGSWRPGGVGGRSPQLLGWGREKCC